MIVVLIGYGEENVIYSLCRHIWEIYIKTANLENVLPIFVQTTLDPEAPTYGYDGKNLTINMHQCLGPSFFSDNEKSIPKQVVGSDWSPWENVFHSEKDRQTFKWISEYFGDQCTHVYTTTVTSLPELNTLRWLSGYLPKQNIFAGTPGAFRDFMGKKQFVFLSGANTLVSRDLIHALASSSPLDKNGLPNDVLRALKLTGIKKIFFPRKDFELAGTEPYNYQNINASVATAFNEGYFHFRVKSKQNRTEKDHLILFDIYRAMHVGLRPNVTALIQKLSMETA